MSPVISVCTVILDSQTYALETFLRSLERSSTLISEVVVADIAANSEVFSSACRAFGTRIPVRHVPLPDLPIPARHLYGHAYGLHHALAVAKENYILFSDNDVFYYLDGFDRLYLDLYEKHALQFLGISFPKHGSPLGAFPVVTNLLFRRDVFPPASFLAKELNELDAANHLALPSTPTGRVLFPVKVRPAEFPNPSGLFHVSPGVNLYLWAKDTNGRWLAFQRSHRYSQSFEYSTAAVSNFKCPRLAKRMLLWHQGKVFGGSGLDDGGKISKRMLKFRRNFRKHSYAENYPTDGT